MRDKILVGMVAKAKVGELEDEIREEFSLWMRKELAGAMKLIYGNRMFLMIFQDGYEKDTTANKITAVTVDRINVNKEAEVTTISVMPDETFDF